MNVICVPWFVLDFLTVSITINLPTQYITIFWVVRRDIFTDEILWYMYDLNIYLRMF